MDTDAIRTQIDRKAAELRALHPELTDCHTVFAQGWEDGRQSYWLNLDLQWPQRQLLMPGPVRAEAGAAIDAAFQQARERIAQSTWASR